MKKGTLIAMVFAAAVSLTAFNLATTKFVSTKTSISVFSHTAVEDISSKNYKAVSTLEPTTGDVVFSVPMQSFEFEKALMQKHFNSPDFFDTKAFPKAKLVAKITNLEAIHFDKDGTYNAIIKGELTLKGVTKPVTEKGTITVKGSSIEVKSKLTILLADYGVTFAKGKPSTNIAKSVDVDVIAEYAAQ